MTKDLSNEFIVCVDEFEGVNEQLLTTLKECERLLRVFLPPRDTAQDIFRDIEGIIEVNDRLVQKKNELLH